MSFNALQALAFPGAGAVLSSDSHPPEAPLLRWAGSKKKLLPLLLKAAPERMRRYIEPFAGSAVLFLKVKPERAILSDINRDLVQTYDVVRARPSAVWKLASALPSDEVNYYAIRALDANSLPSIERAARFVYLNRFCFNGVYRTNRQGQFNVARGEGHLGIPPLATFKTFARRLKHVDLRCVDFQRTVARAGRDDFLYLDPPYAGTGTRDRGEYGPGSFKTEDLERLVASLAKASERGAKILISYADQPDVVRLFKDWRIHRLQVARNVSGFAGPRRRASEVLISNYSW